MRICLAKPIDDYLQASSSFQFLEVNALHKYSNILAERYPSPQRKPGKPREEKKLRLRKEESIPYNNTLSRQPLAIAH